MSNKLTALLCILCCCGWLHAQSLWTDVSERDATITGTRYIIPQTYRTLQLDLPAMQSLLAAALEQSAGTTGTTLQVPMPDGSTMRFRISETPVMAPALQARYPEIRCFSGRGVDDPSVSIKCDLTPWGFHAMVRSRQFGAVFIDPYAQGNSEYYIAYYKKDLLSKGKETHFSCGLDTAEDHGFQPLTTSSNNADTPEFQGDCQLRHYRLALACTGEYAAFHGGTKPLVLAAMNTSMNRVNGLYENDLAVTMQLVPNNDTLIFLNAGSDPYTNNNGGTMLNQNVTTCNNRIGQSNYDIGHVFSTAGGGIAGLGVVCTNSKAQGVTGQSTPIGDGFDIDYVAHEMGHQFGANHTQNNDCNRVPGVAMEPGSASTIMGYAGICAPDVQNNSNDYFHAISLQEIGLFITSGDGNTCPVKTATGNTEPTVNGGANYTIPKSTPFALTAIGNDADGDALTYCWEQMDAQFATMPPVSTNTGGPMFRSYEPSTSATRYFPRLPDLVNNINSDWEELPGVARNMNFRVVARDNKAQGGCAGSDNVVLAVAANSGPFLVTQPNTNVLWYVDDSKTITWDVANTNAAPINCSLVRISLSTDGGFTYPLILADSVANSGSLSVIVPNNISNTCRVKVTAIGNVFFDISNQNFRIQQAPTPIFTFGSSVEALTICAGDSSTFTIQSNAIAGFTDMVSFSASGAPFGAAIAITPGTIEPSGMASVQISNISTLMSGNYSLILTGTSGVLQQSDTIALTIFPGSPVVSHPMSPANATAGLTAGTTLVWEEVNFATAYTVQVASSPAFTDLLLNQTVSGNTAQTQNLLAGHVYYWRVKASNDCGDAPYSETYAFQIQNAQCNQVFTSTDVPMTIDANSVNTALSMLEVPALGVITQAQVSIQAAHSWVGDLTATLSTPWGQDIILFDQPGVPASQYGCGSNNLNLTFSDQAALGADVLENQCNNSNPALSGTFQPIMPLSVLTNQGATGTWRLSIADHVAEDGGSLTGWSLRFCFQEETPAGVLIHNNTLLAPQGGTALVSNTYLAALISGANSQLMYTLLQTPEHGTLMLNGVELQVGDLFSQANIDANTLTYVHNGDASLSDNFHFDLWDANNLSWLPDNIFSIVILQNNLSATATVTQNVSCHNGSDAAISIDASGLDGVYNYSLNGAEPQTGNTFSGLSAGTYSIVVSGQLGFTASAGNVVVSNPSSIVVSTTVLNDNLTVNATGGTGALEYSLDGENFQTDNVFNMVPNGIYTLTVQDANLCTITQQVIVAFNSLLAAAESTLPVTCFGGNDGRISVNAAGGQAPLEYSLNGTDFQSQPVFIGLYAGAYTIIVRDAGGLTTTTNTVTIGEPTQLTLSVVEDINDITLTPFGGTPPYALTINDVATDSLVFIDLPEGVYTFVLTDANGCTATTEATALGNTLVLSFLATEPVSCSGNNDGIIGICIDGGIAPLTAMISPAVGVFNSNVGNCALLASFSALPPGSYDIVITDAAGFTTSTSATITEPAPIMVAASSEGDTLIATATGGTFNYEYSIDGENWQASSIFPDLTPGVYTVYARDIKLCSDTTTFVLDDVATVDPATAWGMLVMPNPGTGLFRLRMLDAPSELRGTVLDITGRTMRSMDFTPGSGVFQTQIDLQDLPQGTYVLRLTDGLHTGAVRLQVLR